MNRSLQRRRRRRGYEFFFLSVERTERKKVLREKIMTQDTSEKQSTWRPGEIELVK